jgi:hypothetical protein
MARQLIGALRRKPEWHLARRRSRRCASSMSNSLTNAVMMITPRAGATQARGPIIGFLIALKDEVPATCLHSPCPEDCGDEIDDGGEAFVSLLVARGNASKDFYAAEEVFDEVPPLVFFSVTLGISTGPSRSGMTASMSLARSRSCSQPASNPLSPIKAKQ